MRYKRAIASHKVIIVRYKLAIVRYKVPFWKKVTILIFSHKCKFKSRNSDFFQDWKMKTHCCKFWLYNLQLHIYRIATVDVKLAIARKKVRILGW